MRLLLDVSAVPARPVGAGVYTVELARHLAARTEIDLHLLARCDDAARWDRIAPAARAHALVPASRPLRLAWEQARGPALARELRVDLWHGPHYTFPVRTAVPAVVTVHDLTFFDHPEWHERSKVTYFRRMISAATERAQALVAVSPHTARLLRERFAPRGVVTVAEHGVDHARFRPASPAEADDDLTLLAHLGVRPPYLAFAGTLEPRKDVPTLVRAFASISDAHPDLRLVLAGRDGWGATAVRDAAAASGVTTRIARVGWWPEHALPALLRQAAAVVYPSLEEGFGLPVLEAMACGAPVVTTTGSAMEDVAGGAAELVPPADPGRLAATLDALLTDDARRQQLAAAGPAQAARFTWDRSVDAHLDAYAAAAALVA